MDFEGIASTMKVRSRYETIYWAGALIWAGLVLTAESLGFLPEVGNASAWSWIFIGVGLFGTLMNVYGTLAPDLDITTTWDYLWSGFWLVLGLSGLFAVDLFWPVVLIIIGVGIVSKTLLRST